MGDGNEYIFEWDEAKNQINIAKHGVSFEQAITSFDDDYAVFYLDTTHSDNEERYIVIGFSTYANLLTVCHCYRGNGNVIRIISARKATKNEAKYYNK